MDFNWINLALSPDPVSKRVPATCFTWRGYAIATDRARIHIWKDPEAAVFCSTDTSPVRLDILSLLFQAIETGQPEFIMDQRQDEHWLYMQISDGSWICFNRKFYEDLKIPFPDTLPVIGSNDWGRFICFKSDNCMGALMEYKIS